MTATTGPARSGSWPTPLDRPGFGAELESGRLTRLRHALAAAGCAGGLFYDPINVRYATGTSNMQVYALHHPCRYVWVGTDGPTVLFEFKGCEHLSDGHAGVDEIRPAVSWYDFVAGPRAGELIARWAAEIASLAGPGRPAVAVDRLDPAGAEALGRHGVVAVDGQSVANSARVVKTAAEVEVIRAAVGACEWSIEQMRLALAPGRTEQEVWAELHRANIVSGGEWLETRLLTSGRRTNPWYQECSAKTISAGELVAFDTDLIGIGGYSVDISRTWLAGADGADADGAGGAAGSTATGEQRRLHDAAREQLVDNIELFRPGASFAEISARAHLPPAAVHSVTNAAVAHGIGLCNEYPLILNRDHFADAGYDGEVETGMVLCVEALAAPPGGDEAVKLEEQILVTEDGPEPLSTYPLDL